MRLGQAPADRVGIVRPDPAETSTAVVLDPATWCSPMHDIRAVRANPAAFDAALARRRLPPPSPEILGLDTERRAALTSLQEKQARRNALSREIGQQKRAGGDTAADEVVEEDGGAVGGDLYDVFGGVGVGGGEVGDDGFVKRFSCVVKYFGEAGLRRG